MKKGSWILGSQQSGIKKGTGGLLEAGQKFWWWMLRLYFKTLGKKNASSLFAVFFFLPPPPECYGCCFFSHPKGSSHVRHFGVSKEPFSSGWMGTGDTRCSHPVTICTGVTLFTRIGHRRSSGTQASAAEFWTRDELANATLCGKHERIGDN